LLGRYVASRDEAAFETLVWRHSALVLGVCRRVLRHEQDAEDAFQASFLLLARKAASIGRRESVRSWLHRVAYRAALAASARRRDCGLLPESLTGSPAEDPVAEAARREAAAAVDAEVARLPERYRVPVVLHYLEGWSYDEVARHLGCSRGTVATKLSRARGILLRRLSRRGVAAPSLLSAGPARTAPPAAPSALVGAALAAVRSNGAGFPTATALADLQARAAAAAKLKALAALTFVAACLAGAAAALSLGPQVRDGDQPSTRASSLAAEQVDDRERNARSLSRLAHALLDYHDAHGRFPPPALTDGAGRPLLSWRVLILPHIGEAGLYREFRLNEPWDGAHNGRLLGRMPSVFAPVRRPGEPPGSTAFQVFAGPGTAFDAGVVRVSDVTDGTARTLLIADGRDAVPWTRPVDLPFAPGKPVAALGGSFPDGFHVALADASVRFLPKGYPEERLRAAITRSGGEVLSLDDPPGEPAPRP
jgi:RNA polymerase sigma factor (sigma-70 family)